MADILLATKTHIPSLHGNLVNRTHLVQRLNEGIGKSRLTILSAPAGYGKSTLLGECISQLDIPAAWLSLEKGENAPARFWKYFITALNEIPQVRLRGIGESLSQVLESPQPAAMEVELIKLVNSLSVLEGRVVLVLDDVHNITETQIQRDLVFLIDHLKQSNGGLHLVVAGRMDPPWPLARWRARGELREFHAADLRFDYEETVQFFHQYLPMNLSSPDIAALQDRTEGWIAGLQMAAISMQGRLKAQGPQGVSLFIESFSGSNRFILDYLTDEVILQQPAEVQDFLLETSILDQFTAALCNAMTGRQDSQKILEQLERANLFLIPLDEERQWYRYHHLFADLLRKWLKQRQPDRFTGLHQRASEWYADHDMLSEAVGHALEAGDVARVNILISVDALAMVKQTDLLDVARRFKEIPGQQISSKPWLQVAYAWVEAYAGLSGEVDRILHQTEQVLTEAADTLEKQHLIGHLASIRSYVAWVRGESNEALKYAHDALENLPEEDWITRSHVMNTEGLAWQYQLNLPSAERSFEKAAITSVRSGKPQVTFTYSNLAYVNLLRGRLRRAFSLCQQVLHSANRSGQGFRPNPDITSVHSTLSCVHLLWNELEAAVTCAREGVSLAEQWKQADSTHFALNCLSEALCAAGDLEEAFAVNQRAMHLAARVSPWYFRLSCCNDIWLNLMKGDIPAAARRFEEIEPLVENGEGFNTFRIMKASIRYAQGRYADVIAVSERVAGESAENGLNWYLMRLLPIRALALNALDREGEALEVIGECLAFAAPEGFARVFVERGEPMARLLQIALRQGIEPKFITELLPAFDLHGETEGYFQEESIPPAARSSGAYLIEPLSERELEVLRFLNTKLSTPEIAREMILSPATIRTHVRNIYAKLDAHGRIEAIQKAKDFNLI